MVTFQDFKASRIGRDIAGRLGLGDCLAQSTSWSQFKDGAVEFNWSDPAKGALVTKARSLHGVASPAERALIQAVLTAVDFNHVAAKLAGRKAWNDLDRVAGDRDLGTAVAACLVRAD